MPLSSYRTPSLHILTIKLGILKQGVGYDPLGRITGLITLELSKGSNSKCLEGLRPPEWKVYIRPKQVLIYGPSDIDCSFIGFATPIVSIVVPFFGLTKYIIRIL